MTQKQFAAFLASLEPYRAKAKRYTRDVKSTCPSEVRRTLDAGAMYIRWIGPQYNVHFLMDFGCDTERNPAMNRQMHRTFEQLPLPRQ